MSVKYAKEITRQVHRARAALVVEKEPGCQWLVDKTEILEALGRIQSDRALLVIARRLCTLRPVVDEAIDMIRQHRQFDQLADEIILVVNGYCRQKPATTRSEIQRALEAASVTLVRMGESDEPGQHQFLRKPISQVVPASPAPQRASRGLLARARAH